MQAALERLRALEPFTDEQGEKRPFLLLLNEQAQDALQAFRVQCREWEVDASGLMKSHIGNAAMNPFSNSLDKFGTKLPWGSEGS